MAPSITSARSSSTSLSLTPSNSPTPALGLSAGAKAGIALGVIIAVLLFLILLVLFFFPYRRKPHHSNQAAEGPGRACDELGRVDAEKTAPSVPQRVTLRGNARPLELATGKGHGGLTQHEQSEMPGVSMPIKQFVIAKDTVLKSEELADAQSSRFEVCTA